MPVAAEGPGVSRCKRTSVSWLLLLRSFSERRRSSGKRKRGKEGGKAFSFSRLVGELGELWRLSCVHGYWAPLCWLANSKRYCLLPLRLSASGSGNTKNVKSMRFTPPFQKRDETKLSSLYHSGERRKIHGCYTFFSTCLPMLHVHRHDSATPHAFPHTLTCALQHWYSSRSIPWIAYFDFTCHCGHDFLFR